MPDPLKEPELYKLVNLYQIHHCTPSCKRKFQKRGAIKEICRYGFPRSPCAKTTLNKLDEQLKSRKNGKSPKKIYNLKRNENETFINDYNPTLLLLWKGNLDLQYIGEHTMALDRYITTYITKSVRSFKI